MNRTVLFLSVVLFAIFAGCKETNDATVEFLNIDKEVLKLTEKEGLGYFGIKSNAKWTLSSNDTWLTFSPASGEGNELIFVSITDQLQQARSATVTVTSKGGIHKAVNVAQGDLELVVAAPEAGVMGRNIKLIGRNFFLIDEVWFGAAKGTIAARADFTMTVTIPLNADRGAVNLKMVYDGSKEMTVGKINLVAPEDVEPIMTIPPRLIKCVGEDHTFSCTFPDEVAEVWFGAIQTVIKGTGNDQITVAIPEIPEGVPMSGFDVKLVYEEGNRNKIAGKISIAYNAGDYYRWKNVTLYAPSYPGDGEKVFCLEDGTTKSICWVKENEILINKSDPSKPFGKDADMPRGYHYIMMLDWGNSLVLTNPNYYSNQTQCNGTPLTEYGLPTVRWIGLAKDPYRQNTGYPESNGGNTLHTPQIRQITCYNGVINGWLTSAQWNDATNELVVVDTKPRGQPAVDASFNISNAGPYFNEHMFLYLDNYTSTQIHPTGGIGTPGGGIYYKTLEDFRIGYYFSLHRGVALWSAQYLLGNGINAASQRQMNGAVEVVSWTKQPDTYTNTMTVNIMRKKTYDESFYSLDPNL